MDALRASSPRARDERDRQESWRMIIAVLPQCRGLTMTRSLYTHPQSRIGIARRGQTQAKEMNREDHGAYSRGLRLADVQSRLPWRRKHRAPPLDEVVRHRVRAFRVSRREDAAPITTITADEISVAGLSPAFLICSRCMTQNTGATQSQQSFQRL